jgi:7-cyano-7-deazaguanine synthase
VVPKKAVVLLSGGLDSSTTLAVARRDGFECIALTFRYGQRHEAEIEASKSVSRDKVTEHRIVEIDLAAFGGSALTTDIPVPKAGERGDSEIPITYVPARNTIFLAYALGWAEVMGAFDVFIGVNSVDYSGYPDCRPEYIKAFETMANLATRAGVEGNRLTIHTPLGALGKGDIVKLGMSLGVDYSVTVTCYNPARSGEACGVCEACALRLQGFADAGLSDPVAYRPVD